MEVSSRPRGRRRLGSASAARLCPTGRRRLSIVCDAPAVGLRARRPARYRRDAGHNPAFARRGVQAPTISKQHIFEPEGCLVISSQKFDILSQIFAIPTLTMQYRIQFLDGNASVILDLIADARNAAGAIALVADLEWPPHAITMRVFDLDQREVLSKIKGDIRR
jgi:hypothetical protein